MMAVAISRRPKHTNLIENHHPTNQQASFAVRIFSVRNNKRVPRKCHRFPQFPVSRVVLHSFKRTSLTPLSFYQLQECSWWMRTISVLPNIGVLDIHKCEHEGGKSLRQDPCTYQFRTRGSFNRNPNMLKRTLRKEKPDPRILPGSHICRTQSGRTHFKGDISNRSAE